jgi:hypothetical protein
MSVLQLSRLKSLNPCPPNCRKKEVYLARPVTIISYQRAANTRIELAGITTEAEL